VTISSGSIVTDPAHPNFSPAGPMTHALKVAHRKKKNILGSTNTPAADLAECRRLFVNGHAQPLRAFRRVGGGAANKPPMPPPTITTLWSRCHETLLKEVFPPRHLTGQRSQPSDAASASAPVATGERVL
jgi:hypothetical protein